MRARNNPGPRLVLSALLFASPAAAAHRTRARAAEAPDAARLLDSALGSASTSYRGRMMVTHWYGRQTRTEEVDIAYKPPNRYRWEFLSPGGEVERVVTSDGRREFVQLVKQHKTLQGEAVKSAAKLMSEDREKQLLLENYRPVVLGADDVVGRRTWILELVPEMPGKQRQKLWIDQETHVILDSKRYRPNGTFTVRSQFTRFEPNPDLPDELFELLPDSSTPAEGYGLGRPDYLTMEELDRAAGKRLGLPRELPGGFEFESGDFFEVRGHTVRHLRYTDGLTILSLFQTDRPVRMPKADPALSADEAPGSFRLSSTGRVLQWRSGDQHYTLMSDASREVLAQVAAAVGSPSSAPAAPAAGAPKAVVSANKWSKITGIVVSADAAARTLRLKDKAGRSEDFSFSEATEIRRNRDKARFSDIRPGDKVKLLRYNLESRQIQRIILSSL